MKLATCPLMYIITAGEDVICSALGIDLYPAVILGLIVFKKM